MQNITNANFGPLIAYLVPGATALWGISEFHPALRSWFAFASPEAPTIGGFLYLTVASIACGMVVNAIRWAVVDSFHRKTGLPLPPLDFSQLGHNVEAFNLLIEIHYRHYQFYSGMCVATLIAYLSHRSRHGGFWPLGWLDVGFLAIEIIFLLTSRNTLRNYYSRGTQLLGSVSVMPANYPSGMRLRKSKTDTPYSLQKKANSITSLRRSPDSHLETNDA